MPEKLITGPTVLIASQPRDTTRSPRETINTASAISNEGGWRHPKQNVCLQLSLQRKRQGSTSLMPPGRTLKWCFVVPFLFSRSLSSTSALIWERAECSQLQVNISSCTLKVETCQATGCYKWEIPRLMDIFSCLIPSLPPFLVFNREAILFPYLLGIVRDLWTTAELWEH